MSEASEVVTVTLSRAQAERLHRILMYDEGRGIYAGNVVSKLRRALDENRGDKVYDWHEERRAVNAHLGRTSRHTQSGVSERPED